MLNFEGESNSARLQMAEFSRIFRHIASMFVLVVLAACSSPEPARPSLAAAEELMDTRPDSALMILQSIPPGSLGSAGGRALYGLLMTQALDKNYVDGTSDSLIRPAVEYYENSSDKLRLMKSLYYLAGVDYYRKAYSESLIASFRAYELARALDDNFWIGMTARRIAEIYGDNYCAKEQMEFARIALDNFRMTDRRPFIHYGIYNLAAAYHANEDYATARQMSHELLDTAAVYNDTPLKRAALELIGLTSIASKDTISAYNAFREIIASPSATGKDTAYYAVMSLRMGKSSEVIDFLPKLFNSPELHDIHKHWLKYNYYIALDSTKQAFEMMSALSDDSDETLKNLRRQNIAGAVMEHHRYRAEIDKANLRLSRLYTIIVIIVASGIICAVVAYWRRRNLRLQRLVDEYMAMINDFKLLLSQAQKDLPSLDLLENFIGEFDTLCKNFRREDSPENRQRIADSVERLVDSVSSDRAWLDDLERYANYRYDNVMVKLRSDFPRLKETDYLIFLLSRLGFSISTVALILRQEDNKTALYNRRRRLKDKFRVYDGANRELYLDVMA